MENMMSNGMKANEVCVPASALSVPGEGEGEMTAPEVGDEVSFESGGKVTRIEGDKAYVQVTKANGEDIAAEKKAPSPMEEEGELQAMGEKADSEY
jgi:hypothetical protein